MTESILIKNINDLLKVLNESNCVREFYILLNGGCRSWKQITLCNKLDRYGRKKVVIFNEIDGSRQVLSVSNLCGSRYSAISSAIRCGSFYLCDNND